MPIIQACHDFLTETAVGKWCETYRFKNKETDDYLHAIHRGMTLLRVETGTKRAFYWIYNIRDAKQFVEHVGLRLKSECHEVIITPRCRFFYDVDLALDEFQKLEFSEHYGLDLTEDTESQVMDMVGDQLAHVFKIATLISLEEHGIIEPDRNLDLPNFDWMFTMRNRKLVNDGFKISIHLITNLMLPLKACSAIASHVKNHVIEDNIDQLGINESMVSPLAEAIDETQYRRHGSLSLPFGTKKTAHGECVNWVHRDYAIHGQRWFITIEDQFSILDLNLIEYNIHEKSNYEGTDASPEFVKEALQHAGNIADYNPRVWDLNASILKRSTMYVKRYAPSRCSVCQRTHDNDNTLFLIFNSEIGVASWKCVRMPTMKPIPFYKREVELSQPDTNEEDISAFTSRHGGRKSKKTPEKKTSSKNLISNRPIKDFLPEHPGAECESDDEDCGMITKKLSIKKVLTRSRKGLGVSTSLSTIKDGYDDPKIQKEVPRAIRIIESTIASSLNLKALPEGYAEEILLKPKSREIKIRAVDTSRVVVGDLREYQ